MNKYIIAFISIFLGAVAQLLLKKGSGAMSGGGVRTIISIFTNKFLFTGLLCYGLSALCWINVLSKMKLSVAYPLVSFGYVLTTLFAFLFLNEEIYMNQIAGLFLIISGIVVITR